MGFVESFLAAFVDKLICLLSCFFVCIRISAMDEKLTLLRVHELVIALFLLICLIIDFILQRMEKNKA